MGFFILGKNKSDSSHIVSGPCSNQRQAEPGWPFKALFLKSLCHSILVKASDQTAHIQRMGSILCLLVEEAAMWNHNGPQTQGAWLTGGHYFNNLQHQLNDSLMQRLLKG